MEVSFGTGWLLTQYASRFDTYGVDLNEKMIQVTTRNLQTAGGTARLQQANVEALPYRSESFDTIVNTAAFSGYPSADRAIGEFQRVLKPGGRLVLIDIGYPKDGNWLGRALARFTEATGDILRDMGPIFTRNGFEYHEEVKGKVIPICGKFASIPVHWAGKVRSSGSFGGSRHLHLCSGSFIRIGHPRFFP